MRMVWVFEFMALLLVVWPVDRLAVVATQPIAKKGCESKCGNVPIPYPFGIGKGCYGLGELYEILCEKDGSHQIAYLKSFKMEVLDISIPTLTSAGYMMVNSPVIYSNCGGNKTAETMNFTGTPFFVTVYRNFFAAVGCNSRAIITDDELDVFSGCHINYCEANSSSSSSSSSSRSVQWCKSSLPGNLKSYNIELLRLDNTAVENGDECKYAFVVEQKWFGLNLENDTDIHMAEYVPAALEWWINIGTTPEATQLLKNTTLVCTTYIDRFYCYCKHGFEGNPYIECQDVNECDDPSLYLCPSGTTCENTYGSYRCRKSPTKIIFIGVGSSLGLILILLGVWWLYRFIKKRRDMKQKQFNFKRNGGILLQQLCSSDGKLERTKLFNSNDLKIATDNFSKDRVVGHGGHGTVYKGMLADGRIVAVKKSKIVDEGNLEQFINEVVILSQINHRNIVKILGCCLETEVPLLVYEFILNGTLSDYIHNQSEEFHQISWEMRLQIASEVAGALSYLHSAAAIPIYHRDIKSTNILLDEKYKAKVCDFGTSRSITVEQTHLTTVVSGTFGYLDPEYFQSSQFTDKSDVYSFGVVLAEILTGQTAISFLRSEEERSLAIYFIIAMEENRHFDIFDRQVLKQGGKDVVMAVAELAQRCLQLNGRNRPTMKQVATTLDAIRMSQVKFQSVQSCEKIELEMRSHTNAPSCPSVSTSAEHGLGSSMTLSIDVEPLIPSHTS